MFNKNDLSIYDVLTPSHLEGIGAVASQWSAFEHSILFTLSSVSKIDIEKILIFVNNGTIVNWLETLLAYVGYDDLELKALVKKANDIRIERNDIVHAFWSPSKTIKVMASDESGDLTEGLIVGFGLPKSKKNPLSKYAFTPESIFEIAKKIDDLDTEFFNWNYQRNLRLTPES